MKKLIFFTFSYPFGVGEQWKENELKFLITHYDKIEIIPFTFGGNTNPKEVPGGVIVHTPLFDVKPSKLLWCIKALFNKRTRSIFAKEFIKKEIYTNWRWFRSWLSTWYTVVFLLAQTRVHNILRHEISETDLYFYWGTGSIYMLPFIDIGKCNKIVCRFHGGDLYEERTIGYLPLRGEIYKNLTHAVFISEHGKKYAMSKYPEVHGKCFLHRLGVFSRGQALGSRDGVLRIVTCSFMVPVKRLDLLIRALKQLDIALEWTHIGSGELWDQLITMSKTLPSNVKTNFVGNVPSERVFDFYAGQFVDLFINVSSSEGVPVSIMEALSAGIPIFATDVGGTSELVDDQVGKLLAENITPKELAGYIIEFALLPQQMKQNLRDRSVARFMERCNAEKQYKQFANFLANNFQTK